MYTRVVSEADASGSPGGVAGSLLAELEAGGELIDTGGFTIDTVDARRKLRDHLLADPHAYVLLLVEAAVIGVAQRVRVETEGGEVRVGIGSARFAASELEQLFAAVFIDVDVGDVDERNRRRALQLVAYACNAALRLEPREIEITTPDGRGGGHRLRLTAEDERGKLEPLDREITQTSVRVAHQGSRERELVRERCVFSSIPIELDGQRVSKNMQYALHVELAPDELSFSPRGRSFTAIELDGRRIGTAGMRYAGKLPAEVTILTNGVLAERFVLGDEQRRAAPDFGAVVDVDLRKDLGQNKVVRGPEFERVMAAIWAVHDEIVPKEFDAPVTGHASIGGGLEQFRLPVALIGIGVLLGAWGLAEHDGYGEILAVFGIILAAAGIVGVVLGALRSLKR